MTDFIIFFIILLLIIGIPFGGIIAIHFAINFIGKTFGKPLPPDYKFSENSNDDNKVLEHNQTMTWGGGGANSGGNSSGGNSSAGW